MAFFEDSVDRATALAATCGWLAFGGGAEAAVGVAIGAAGLVAVVSDAVRKHGPESRAALEKMRKSIRTDLEFYAATEGWDNRADLEAADKAMDRALTGCFLDRKELAESSRSSVGFPDAATPLILNKLASREPTVFGPQGSDVAKKFAHLVVRAALEAAIENEGYFRRLEPHLLMETLRGIGTLEEKLTDIGNDIKRILEIIQPVKATQRDFTGRDIRLEMVVNSRGEIIFFHDKPFDSGLLSIQFDIATFELFVHFRNSGALKYSIAKNDELIEYVKLNSTAVALAVLMDRAGGNPIEGRYVPFFCPPDSEQIVRALSKYS
ncbi:hypothetical protein [Ruegeria sp. Ofav3-42]|uniref:hypothetical protein n=1 Tax=Ruegeria sp. Ofav3-42 TaxID=2917759 RepID=UPI001EF52DAB|nr:hypothetical protein [Ruegeria sp. Ofav3-42]MCG7522316.1 hypothetical protein [Ruegeria sp. Ofav3-42]